MRHIHICFATDDGYAPYCVVAIKSIIMNADPKDKLFFYILHANLSKDKIEILDRAGNFMQSSIRIVRLDKTDFTDMPLVVGGHYSYIETYFRFAIPRLLKEVAKVLYLDCDILVRDSLWGLYNQKIDEKVVGMIRDNGDKLKPLKKQEFNAGIILINCEKWREEDIESKLYKYAEENPNMIKGQDQEVLNAVLQNQIFELEDKYNKQIRFYDLSDKAIDEIAQDQNIVILHYLTDRKPWHGVYQNKLVDEYFSYMEQTTGYRDRRSQDCNIDAEKYYGCMACLRYFLDMGMIYKEKALLLVFENEIKHEFEFAANKLGFLHVETSLVANLEEKLSKFMFVLIDSYDYGRVSREMRSHGYFYCKDYIMTCLFEDCQRVKNGLKSLGGYMGKVIVYGTGDWAERYTEALKRIGAEILFYLDSNKAKDGSAFHGKDVIHPDRLSTSDMYFDKILIASSAFPEIQEGLIKRGIDREKIITFDFMKK